MHKLCDYVLAFLPFKSILGPSENGSGSDLYWPLRNSVGGGSGHWYRFAKRGGKQWLWPNLAHLGKELEHGLMQWMNIEWCPWILTQKVIVPLGQQSGQLALNIFTIKINSQQNKWKFRQGWTQTPDNPGSISWLHSGSDHLGQQDTEDRSNSWRRHL